MSIDVIKRVWDNSMHGGSQLLLLLALADHADIDGVCWPGHPLLAKKTRVSQRQAIRLSRQLEDSGEIFILKGGGRGLSNSYLITIGLTEDEIQTTLVQHPRLSLSVSEAIRITTEIMARLKQGSPSINSDTDDTFSTRKGDADVTLYNEENSDIHGQNSDIHGQNSDICDQKTVTLMSPEPSSNNRHVNRHINRHSSDFNLEEISVTAAQAAASAKQLTAELVTLYKLPRKKGEALCQSLVEEFALGRHPPETIKQAYQKALGNQKIKRPGPYARAILNDWAETGPPESEVNSNGNGNGNSQNGHGPQSSTTPGGYPEGRLSPGQLKQLDRWREQQRHKGNGLVS